MRGLVAGLALLAAGCGDGDGLGPVDDLRAYRTALEPVVQEVSAVEAEVIERAVGSANVATAANLDAVYRQVRPRLLETLVELDRIAPPPQLEELHGEIRAMIILRLDAYALVMRGYAAGDASLYPLAEDKLHGANALVPDINQRLCAVDVALGDRDDCRILS
ncbi:MAG: hypothetical protein ABIL09_05380 [Gemmatimonadota bacterium]